jgi:hypothetical protein
LGKVVNVGGGGNADKAINKNDENIIALALPDPPTQQPTDDDDAEGITIKKLRSI